MTEKAFERLARRALLDANRADWAPVLEGAGALAPEFSPRYRRRRLRLVNDPFSYAKKAARPAWKRAARTAACLLLAFALSFGALMAVSPEVRAWVQEVFIQWKSDHAAFRFNSEPDPDWDGGVWRPVWLPEGVELVEEKTSRYVTQVIYEEPDGTRVYFYYAPEDGSTVLGIDNEHQKYSETTINGHPAYLLSAKEGYMSFLIWVDEEHDIVFQITSELSAAEMVKMAESIEKVG